VPHLEKNSKNIDRRFSIQDWAAEIPFIRNLAKKFKLTVGPKKFRFDSPKSFLYLGYEGKKIREGFEPKLF
jgi:hypothetical protein